MKWKTKFNLFPVSGDKRRMRVFPIFPHSYDGTTYWLAKITLHQTYFAGFSSCRWSTDYVTEGW